MVKDAWNVDWCKGSVWFLCSSQRCNTFNLFTRYLDLFVNVLAARAEALILLSFSKNTFPACRSFIVIILMSLSPELKPEPYILSSSPSCMDPQGSAFMFEYKNNPHLRNWSDVQSEVWTTLVTKKMSMFTNSSIFIVSLLLFIRIMKFMCCLTLCETLEIKSTLFWFWIRTGTES